MVALARVPASSDPRRRLRMWWPQTRAGGARHPPDRTGQVRHDDQVIVTAGTPWDDFVAQMVAEGRSGIESLSGIPGSVGATPIQNVGAYRPGSRADHRGHAGTCPAAQVRSPPGPLPGRNSVPQQLLQGTPAGIHVVLAVAFDLPEGLSAPVKYAELAGLLQVDMGQRVPVAAVRAGGPGITPRQGYGARSHRPGHPQRRLLLHQPDRGVTRPRVRPAGRSRTAG